MASIKLTPSRRVLAARRNGRLGGLATAKNSSQEFLEERARKAGEAVRENYGVEYYGHIARSHRNRKSTKKVIKEVVNEIISPPQAAPNTIENVTPLQLMQAAAKSCSGN